MILPDNILGRGADNARKFWLGTLGLIVAYFALSGVALSLVNNVPLLTRIDDHPVGGLMFVLLSVALIHMVLWPWIRMFYGRSYTTVLNPLSRPIMADANYATGLAVGAFLISEVAFLRIFWSQITWEGIDGFGMWWVWVVPILVATLLQVTGEEFFFRGFLQPYLARIYRRRWVYIGVPALLWALPHWGNLGPMHLKPAFVVLIFVLGLIMGDMANRTKSLIGPIVLHFNFNIFSMCVYGNSMRSTNMQIITGDFSGLSNATQAGYFIWMAVPMAVVYLLLRTKLKPE